MRTTYREVRALAAALVLGAALVGTAAAAAGDDDNRDRELRVMTINMDEATDFGPIFAAKTPAQLLSATAAAFQQVQASNIPERANGIAAEIGAAAPDLVGLQEVSLFQTGPFLHPPATTVAFDMLQSLLDALAARGLAYAPVAVLVNTDSEAPSALGVDVRITNRDVMLMRTDLPASELALVGVQTSHFTHNLTLSFLGGTVTDLRGWIAVDARKRGKPYRFVTTHLEAYSSALRSAQAAELIAGHADTTLPVIFGGDFNSDADSGDPLENDASRLMADAGFLDAWTTAQPADPGFTWPLHCEDTFTPCSTPRARIDLLLFRGPVSAADARLLGTSSADLTPSGLWPSDHAAVAGTFVLAPDPHER